MGIQRVKAWIKAAIGWATVASSLHRSVKPEQGIVVAFHRVNGEQDATGLTVSPEVFERYCRFFSAHYAVVSLSHFVKRLQDGHSVGGLLDVTFDAGNRDNFEIAAPILKRWNLPATFFVTSQFINSRIVPEWDRDAGLEFPWMTWEEVVSLRQQGFEIGAHTKHHVDLGKAQGDLAREEIHGSRADLEEKLGAAVRLFAYPFGRADQMSETNRVMVKEAGYDCCCSCFGGVNTRSTDPFSIQRVPISTWLASPYQFAFETTFAQT